MIVAIHRLAASPAPARYNPAKTSAPADGGGSSLIKKNVDFTLWNSQMARPDLSALRRRLTKSKRL
jgi:hypothetical protein